MMRMLIVTNYQNMFLTGSQATPLAKLISDKIEDKVNEYLSSNDWVIFTHVESKDETADTWQQQYPDSFNKFFEEYPDDIIEMRTGSDELVSLLKAFEGYWSSIEICGIFAESGVIANLNTVQSALGSKCPKIYINVDTIAGATTENKMNALKIMKSMKDVQIYCENSSETA